MKCYYIICLLPHRYLPVEMFMRNVKILKLCYMQEAGRSFNYALKYRIFA